MRRVVGAREGTHGRCGTATLAPVAGARVRRIGSAHGRRHRRCHARRRTLDATASCRAGSDRHCHDAPVAGLPVRDPISDERASWPYHRRRIATHRRDANGRGAYWRAATDSGWRFGGRSAACADHATACSAVDQAETDADADPLAQRIAGRRSLPTWTDLHPRPLSRWSGRTDEPGADGANVQNMGAPFHGTGVCARLRGVTAVQTVLAIID